MGPLSMTSASKALINPRVAQVPPEVASLASTSLWIGTKDLSALAEISERKSREALDRSLNGATWRRHLLEVRTIEGSGGRGGKALQVYVPSLPPDLRERFLATLKTDHEFVHTSTPALPAPEYLDPAIYKRHAERCWKIELLAPALAHPPRSHARGKELRRIAAKEYPAPNGKTVKPSLTTLREWLRNLETEGEQTLVSKPREQNVPRAIVNRTWDAACPLSAEEKAEIREELDTYLASAWAGGVPGVNRVVQFASSRLVELSRVHGWPDANLENCNIGRYLAEQYRKYSVIALKERNAKAFFDKMTPRIKVNRKKLKPGDVVVGDVHPFDVQKLEGGRIVHARLICWLDLATYDIFVDVVILGPGRGIRQEDIAASFVNMVLAWGLPKQLRLDNGKEYKWDAMMKGFHALSAVVRTYSQVFLPSILGEGEKDELLKDFTPRNVISRARPYNAPAKQIEGVQGILEYYFFSMMPGWIGGDRMNKRTHKVGEAPRAHEGDDEVFARDIALCIRLYRDTEQSDGSSPNSKRRAAYATGFTPVRVDLALLVCTLSETEMRMVHNDGIEVNGRFGMIDELVPHIGHKVETIYAKWYKAHAFYRNQQGKLFAVPLGDEWDHDDPAGAKEQSRLVSVQNAFYRTLKEKTEDMDLMAEVKRHLGHMPPPPELPDGIRITTAEGNAIAAAIEVAKEPAKQKLPPLSFRHPKTGEVMRPALVEQAEPVTPAFDIYALPPPEKKKPDQSADGLGFDIYKVLTKRPPLNHEEKETERP